MKTKHTGWINVYLPYYTHEYKTSVKVFDTFKDAREHIVEEDDYIDTIKVEFYDNE